MSVCFASSATFATEVEAQSAGGTTSATDLEGLSVVAQDNKSYVAPKVGVGAFRDQSIMDVPATVNVVTRALMDVQADVSLYDVLRNTAGVTKQQLSGETFDNLAIRGIILDNRSNYRLNGSLPLLNQMQIPLEDKEQVEVLKGVSALYYGYTAPGGVVNMVTKRPASHPITSIGLSTDNDGSIVGSADISRRFGDADQYGLRVNAAGGGQKSPVDGIGGHRRMASVAFDWRASDRLNVRFDGEYFQRAIVEQTVLALPAAKDGHITLPRIPDPSNRLAPNWANFSAHGSNLLLHGDYALSDRWLVTVEAGRAEVTRGRRAFTQLANYDFITGKGTLSGNRQDDARLENRNLRAELLGTFDTLAVSHELTVGAAQTHSVQGAIATDNFSGTQYLYAPIALGWLPTTKTTTAARLTAVDKGLYATDRLGFGEHWQAIWGERYTNYTSDQGASHFKASKTTPLGALIYKFTPRLMAYGSYASGIEQGDSAPNTAVNVNDRLPPSISKQKEIGVRWQPSSALLLSSAAFDINRAASYVNSDDVFVQNGRERYRGVEASAQGQLTPALMFQLSGQYLKARFENISADLEGKIPENTPRLTGSLFAQYAFTRLAGLSLNGGIYYTGRRPVNDLNQATLGGASLLSLGGRYTQLVDGKHVTWQFNIDNLANKRYWAATGNNRLAVGLPRTLKLSMRLDL